MTDGSPNVTPYSTRVEARSLLMALSQALSWQEAALDVLRDRCGDIQERRVHQTWGDRVVIEARTARFPRGVVLKASREQSVRAEVYAARCAERAGVPVPAILAEGTDERLPGQDWFVMRRAEGQPWAMVAQVDAQRARTLADIGHVFASLHGVRMRNYGPLTPSLGGRYRSWAGWLHAELLACAQPLIREGHLPPHFMRLAEDVLRSLAPQLENVRPALVHGDLGDQEIFVDARSGAVTAIVDWGDALCGDALYDFARFVAGGPAADERPALYLPDVKQAYARDVGCDPAALEGQVPALYAMHNAVRNAAWCVREESAWIGDLCAHAMSIVSTLR